MGRQRTTGCKEAHFGSSCTTCARIRKRRSRRGNDKTNPQYKVSLDPQLDALKRARAYVDAYLRRGAIVPPASCNRCRTTCRPSRLRPTTPLYAVHPDPGKPREVVWLCKLCRTEARLSQEPLLLCWTWPGYPTKRSRSEPDLKTRFEATTAQIESRIPNATTMTRQQAVLGTVVNALTLPEREWLYVKGIRAGEHWAPTGNGLRDALLRDWVTHLHVERDEAAHQNARLTRSLPAQRPRTRRVQIPSISSSSKASIPTDPAIINRRIAIALDHLAKAEETADAINTRVSAALERLLARPSTRSADDERS